MVRAYARLAAVMAAAACCLGLGAATASAASGDIGFEGPAYGSLSGSPTGSKPESKLWFNDGQWWASMWSANAGEYQIFRLDRASETWTSTGTALDPRPTSRADARWVPSTSKLYVASHRFVTNGGPASAANAGWLFRYSYNASARTYSLDPGYPVAINAAQTETLVIDRDSTGTLWATWTQGSQVYVNHTVGGDDAVWATPFVVPGPGSTLDSDDISSLIAFAGRIGIAWSNQADGHVYFSTHVDGAAASAWSTEVVPTGQTPDDHINLKADRSGRVYAAIKTSDEGSQPLTMLAVRSSGGGWSVHTFGTGTNSHTRPIVELDEQHGVLLMLATCPQPPHSSGQSGGDICIKTTSMSAPSFAPGIGTAVIRDASSDDMNDATSTKQSLTSLTGLVVLANDDDTNAYWHADISLGTDILPPEPTATPGSSSVAGQGLLGVTVPGISLHAKRLHRQRVQLWGAVAPISSALRVTLSRLDRHGRWLPVAARTTRLRPGRMGTFSFVVRRAHRRLTYRVMIRIAGAGPRSSRRVLLGRRR